MQLPDITGNPRILIIDDNKSIHEDFYKIIGHSESEESDLADLKEELFGDTPESSQAYHFDLDSAYQGQEGLAKVQESLKEKRPYALAFIDVRMPPGWDGIETISHIWKEDPDLQIVICTAYSDHNWGQIIRQLGRVDGFLILKKPFDNVEVVQLAHALSTKWLLHQQSQADMSSLEAMVADRVIELSKAKEQLEQEIHDRERIEIDLRLAQKLEAIGQLAAGIAHEINTPTQYVSDNTNFVQDSFKDIKSVLVSYAKLLESCQVGSVDDHLLKEISTDVENADLPYLLEEIPNAIGQSLDGIGRISKIVRAMKEFSHPGTDEKLDVDINQVIDNTITVSRNEWKYIAEIEKHFDRTMPMIPCLPGEFSQVILNMLINATHAIADVVESGKKGTITITTDVIDGMARVQVADTGSGISDDIRDKIFDPFFTTKGVGKGTGQGLAIARSVIIDKLGGKVRYESRKGHGATFIIDLPIGPADKAQPPQEQSQ